MSEYREATRDALEELIDWTKDVDMSQSAQDDDATAESLYQIYSFIDIDALAEAIDDLDDTSDQAELYDLLDAYTDALDDFEDAIADGEDESTLSDYRDAIADTLDDLIKAVYEAGINLYE